MPPKTANPSARQTQLLEASYEYALTRSLTDLSLRPLAEAIGSCARVWMFLFGNKDGLVRALLERARTDELPFWNTSARPTVRSAWQRRPSRYGHGSPLKSTAPCHASGPSRMPAPLPSPTAPGQDSPSPP
jgi:hypothetical protein